MADDLASLDAVAQADLVRSKKASPLELVDAAIARIERTNPELGAVIHELFEAARTQASGALPDGPFRGVPFLLKDLDAPLAGAPFHAGMQFLKDRRYVPPQSAYYADKILSAGFVVVGKTNTPELGLTVTTEPAAYGPSRNPWSTKHSTGGSSGGSAAAVAAGMTPVAHAGDGGGSIRIPASECGLVGLKPSRGRVSLGPHYGEYWSGLVASHVVSRSVRDTARILDVVAGAMTGDPYVAPEAKRPYAEELRAKPGRLRVGLFATLPGGAGDPHPECVRAVRDTAALLAELGHDVEESHPAVLDRTAEQTRGFMGIVTAWVAAALAGWEEELGGKIDASSVEPGTWGLAELGRAQSAAELIGHLKWLGLFTREAASWWESGFDLLLTPTLAVPPPEIGALGGSPDDPFSGIEKVLAVIPYTPAYNLTGQPAMSLPMHWTPDGLPVGVQLVAAYGREDLLIRVAAQLEEARPWAGRRPHVWAG
ncbi:MAG: amidase [Deltaproteobacteria bacterium]|nr:amidase [Deltaproteobacteria bacterium]